MGVMSPGLFNAVVLINPKDEDKSLEQNISVERGEPPAGTAAENSSSTKDSGGSRRPTPATQGPAAISGGVLASNNKPAANAFLAVVAFNVQPKPGATDLAAWPQVLAEGTTSADGKFKLELGNVTSKTHVYPSLLARTKDSGVVWKRLDLDASLPNRHWQDSSRITNSDDIDLVSTDNGDGTFTVQRQ